jgi:glutamyl/glutaminyl-tRNA synthetase
MTADNPNSAKNIVVRFPPSPTGEVHIGNVRTLLFNFLFAKKMNGKIVFRFEDTDKERSQKVRIGSQSVAKYIKSIYMI